MSTNTKRKTPSGYRLVREGTIIREGDLYFSPTNGWLPELRTDKTCLIGVKREWDHIEYCRAIKHPAQKLPTMEAHVYAKPKKAKVNAKRKARK